MDCLVLSVPECLHVSSDTLKDFWTTYDTYDRGPLFLCVCVV